MDATLLEIVRQRLRSDGVASAAWARLVVAAISGEPALRAALDDQDATAQPQAPDAAGAASVYVNAITVAGFRGIGPACRLELSGAPGLTLIVGRNGSGKSSLSEALEFLLTGENRRWSTRSKVWKDGWRNLHQTEDARIEAELTIEGDRGRAVVTRQWPAEAGLDDAETAVQRHGLKKTKLAALGWQRPLELYRPFLSYNELGAMFDEGPSAFHDRLSAMLGLEDLVDGQRALQRERLVRTKAFDASDAALKILIPQLVALDDDRVRALVPVLQSKKRDLAALGEVLAGKTEGGDDSAVAALRRLLALEVPQAEDVEVVAAAARDAKKLQAPEQSSARALELADLLSTALEFHGRHKEKTCPICGEGTLDATWKTQTAATVERLRHEAESAGDAAKAAGTARAAARGLVQPMPAFVTSLRGVLRSTEAVASAWSGIAKLDLGSLDVIATKLPEAIATLRSALENARAEAAEDLERREAPWRRATLLVAPWLAGAREAETAAVAVAEIKQAEKWLKDAADDIRSERFRPVADEAKRLWQILRQQSNVELEVVALAGSGPTRHPVLTVDVDGVETDALSVMSQGELSSIALSLFLPRATLPESPFRFVVIDDPVQSMDPARVEGLARVLASAAETRQVIVLTHDDRLREAVRRLNIDATVIAVTRRERSVLELREELDPVERNLADARAIALTTDLPRKTAERVIPGFCRAAIEAACMEVVRRRRLGRGDKHADVEDALDESQGLNSLAALALFDDETKAGEVRARIERSFGPQARDAFKICNQGSHVGFEGDLMGLIRNVTQLAKDLRALK